MALLLKTDCAVEDTSPPKPTTNTTDLVRTYLREIGRVPLLTREQEIVYAKQVQQMIPLLEAKEALALTLRREPTIREWTAHIRSSETEVAEVVRQGQRAKQKMVEANLRLVVAIAKRYQKRGLELLDLIQEGTIGLMRGVEKFDPTRGYKFSTYAYWWITQGITRATGEKGRTIRLPIHIIEKLNKIKKAQGQLSQHLGRIPNLTELAAELELTPKQVRECLGWARQPISLDLRMGDNQDTDLGELLSDIDACPEDYVIQSELATELEPLLAELTPQQRQVLTLRFGLVDGQSLTFAKIGTRLHLSRERVRQIERKALKELQKRHLELQPFSEGQNL